MPSRIGMVPNGVDALSRPRRRLCPPGSDAGLPASERFGGFLIGGVVMAMIPRGRDRALR